MKNLVKILLGSVAALPLLSGIAWAQQSAATAGGTVGLEEVVVTATREKTNVQSAAVAITAISGARLAEAGINDVSDLSKIAPSIQFTPIRSRAITYIRGVGQGISAINADPAVAFNLNNAYLPAEVSSVALFDIDRVEVVYGPQGTLYGRNAVGGAINIFTRRPGQTFGGDASIDVGNYRSFIFTGAVDLPVTPDLAVRAVAYRQSHEGYFTNGLSDADQTAGRVSAVYSPNDDTSVALVGGVSRQRGFGAGVQNVPPLTSNPWYLPYDPRSVPIFTDTDAASASLEINHRFSDDLHLVFIAGFADLNHANNFPAYQNSTNPFSAPNIQFVNYNIDTRNYTQELRLNGEVSKLKWIAGLYGYEASGREFSTVRAQNPVIFIENGPFRQKAHGAAVFGQLTYSVTDALRLVAGGRYSYDTKSINGINNIYPPALGRPVRPTVTYVGSRSDSRPDVKLGVEYDVAPQSLLYANFQTGYNTGGFSNAQAVLTSTAAARFEPMTVQSYSLGSKNRFWDNRLQLNVEGFYNRYSDYQVSARSLQTGQATVYNAAKATVYGAQIDARVKLTSNDELGVSVGLLKTKFNTLVIPAAPFNLSGFTLPNAPSTTANVDYTHSFPLGSGASVDFAANYKYVSGQWGVYTHGAGTYIRAYDMEDASLTYWAPMRQWSVGAYVKNITDEFVNGFVLANAIPGPGSGFPMPPRTYGVRLSANF